MEDQDYGAGHQGHDAKRFSERNDFPEGMKRSVFHIPTDEETVELVRIQAVPAGEITSEKVGIRGFGLDIAESPPEQRNFAAP